jgi:hypothetical protein
MNRVLFALVVFGVAHASHAEIVTVPIEGIVTKVEGMPFDIPLEVNVTPATGSFKYDTATPPTAVSGHDADYSVTIPDGVALNLPGLTLSSSNYNVHLSVHSVVDRSFDIVGIEASATGHGFLVNGVPAPEGGVAVHLADADNTIFSNSNSLRMLPSQSQVDQLDFIQFSRLSDGSGNFEIGSVPEPDAVLLASQLLFLFSRRSRRQ